MDHDLAFARELSGLLWSADVPESPFWPTQVSDVGAFPGGSLPGAGLAPVLYPDISICGAGRSFQILVEVKVTADFHGYADPTGRSVLQPDAYVLGWEAAPEELPRERRRVGTISPSAPPRQEDNHPMRGSDLLWEADVIPLLLSCAARRGPLDGHVGSIALDLATAVRSRLSPPPREGRPVSSELTGLAAEWRPRLIEALRLLEESWPGTLAPGRVTAASDYLGTYLTLGTPHSAQPARIWVFLTTADGKYNREGEPSSACVCLWEPGPVQCPPLHRSLRGPLAAPGARRADRMGETACRVYRSLASLAGGQDPASELASWVESILTTSGLLPSRPDS